MDWEARKIEVSIEMEVTGSADTFRTKVVGVTHQNADGSSRQEILPTCKRNESLILVREPDNSYDRLAIQVRRRNGEMLGYLRSDVSLATHIDRGGETKARIVAIVGGPTFLERLLNRTGKNYGCVIEIAKGDFDWSAAEPFMKQSRIMDDNIRKARSMEDGDPSQAIQVYKTVIRSIAESDEQGTAAKAWRSVRIPINRLTLLLERQGMFDECLNFISWYESYNDQLGLTKQDADSLAKRKKRVVRRTSKNTNGTT